MACPRFPNSQAHGHMTEISSHKEQADRNLVAALQAALDKTQYGITRLFRRVKTATATAVFLQHFVCSRVFIYCSQFWLRRSVYLVIMTLGSKRDTF